MPLLAPIFTPGWTLGEAPLWDAGNGCLYGVDIPRGLVWQYRPATEAYTVLHEGGVVGALTLEEDGTLLLYMEAGAVRALLEERLVDVVAPLPELEGQRYNDVWTDAAGRVLAGLRPLQGGSTGPLYRLDPDGRRHVVIPELEGANGMGFSPDGRTLYVTETEAGRVHAYAYEAATGRLGKDRVFATFPKAQGRPDGLAVDAEGGVWSALWEGAAVVRHLPDGREAARYALPHARVTSMAFGGPDLRDLYVTTAAPEGEEHGGALFLLRPGPEGLPTPRSRLRLAG